MLANEYLYTYVYKKPLLVSSFLYGDFVSLFSFRIFKYLLLCVLIKGKEGNESVFSKFSLQLTFAILGRLILKDFMKTPKSKMLPSLR